MGLRTAVFWGTAAITGWTLGGYAGALALRRSRPWATGEGELVVSVIVPAFNEREALAEKLRALEGQDYPAERLEVLVAVDFDEETAELARAASPRAIVSFSPERGGKAAGLNRALGIAKGDVIVMTDSNNILDPGSISSALRHFADPAIVAVAGRRGEVGSAYDRYEDLLRRLESRSGSVAAMSGEFMAVRRSALDSFPSDVVNDDLWLLCKLVREGGRVVYEPAAFSLEEGLGASAELTRRSRIGAGRMMLVAAMRGLPPGFQGRLISHKFGRLVLPWALLGLLGSSLALGRRRPYREAAVLQVAAYAVAGASVAGVEPPGPAGPIARAARQFLLGNVAIAIGVVRGLRRRQSVTWEAVR
jgi:biofilm PGA synthesis N-glycosyltransferase PgaC